LINPWENAAQIAQNQLLQSIVQVINTGPLPNMTETSLLRPPILMTQFTDIPQAPLEFPDYFCGMDYPLACFEDGFQPEVADYYDSMSSDFNAQTRTELPAIDSALVEGSTFTKK